MSACLIGVLLPTPSWAQSGARFALGGGVAFHAAPDERVSGGPSVSLVYRLWRRDGWTPAVGFGWFNTTIDGPSSAGDVPLGRLRVRPLMGGVAYSVVRGPWTTTASAVAGVSFNGVRTDDDERRRYQQITGHPLTRVSTSNALAARGQVAVWYDINDRVGVTGSLSYVAVRPDVRIVSDQSSTDVRLRADVVRLQFGAAYRIF